MALLANDASAQPDAIKYGMDLSFWRVDMEKLGLCTKERRNNTIAGGVFLTRYNDPMVRSRVREQLRQMRSSGFEELRTHIFSGKGPLARDRFDLEGDKSRAAGAVRKFADDVAESGFELLHIVFSTQGPANPACRIKRWGDCFSGSTTAAVLDFMFAVRRGLDGAAIKLRFDLAPEKCAAKNLPEPLRSNLGSYVEQIVSGYTAEFPNDATTVSCGIKRFREAKQSIDGAYAAAGRRPSLYEIHAYRTRSGNSGELLQGIKESLKGSNIPILVGETNYGDANHLKAIIDTLHAAGGGLRAVYFWPLRDAAHNCHVDTAPPYRLLDAKGLRAVQ